AAVLGPLAALRLQVLEPAEYACILPVVATVLLGVPTFIPPVLLSIAPVLAPFLARILSVLAAVLFGVPALIADLFPVFAPILLHLTPLLAAILPRILTVLTPLIASIPALGINDLRLRLRLDAWCLLTPRLIILAPIGS